jgi:hypothetical protein
VFGGETIPFRRNRSCQGVEHLHHDGTHPAS